MTRSAYPGRRPQQRVMSWIRQEITAGRLQPGDQLPTFPALAKRLEVNPLTVRRALLRLQDQGLVEVRARVGTFVRTPDQKRPRDQLYFTLACPRWMLRVDREHPLLLTWLEGLDLASRGRGVQVSARFFDDDTFASELAIYAEAGECDGILAFSWWRGHANLHRALRSCNAPSLIFHPFPLRLPQVGCFTVDMEQAMYLALRDAARSGARHVGGLWYQGEEAINDRLIETWLQALETSGLGVEDSPYWLVDDPTDPAAWDVVDQALSASVDALVVWDEFLVDAVHQSDKPLPYLIALQDLKRHVRAEAPPSFFGPSDHLALMGSAVRQLADAARGRGRLIDLLQAPNVIAWQSDAETQPAASHSESAS